MDTEDSSSAKMGHEVPSKYRHKATVMTHLIGTGRDVGKKAAEGTQGGFFPGLLLSFYQTLLQLLE